MASGGSEIIFAPETRCQSAFSHRVQKKDSKIFGREVKLLIFATRNEKNGIVLYRLRAAEAERRPANEKRILKKREEKIC